MHSLRAATLGLADFAPVAAIAQVFVTHHTGISRNDGTRRILRDEWPIAVWPTGGLPPTPGTCGVPRAMSGFPERLAAKSGRLYGKQALKGWPPFSFLRKPKKLQGTHHTGISPLPLLLRLLLLPAAAGCRLSCLCRCCCRRLCRCLLRCRYRPAVVAPSAAAAVAAASASAAAFRLRCCCWKICQCSI